MRKPYPPYPRFCQDNLSPEEREKKDARLYRWICLNQECETWAKDHSELTNQKVKFIAFMDNQFSCPIIEEFVDSKWTAVNRERIFIRSDWYTQADNYRDRLIHECPIFDAVIEPKAVEKSFEQPQFITKYPIGTRFTNADGKVFVKSRQDGYLRTSGWQVANFKVGDKVKVITNNGNVRKALELTMPSDYLIGPTYTINYFGDKVGVCYTLQDTNEKTPLYATVFADEIELVNEPNSIATDRNKEMITQAIQQELLNVIDKLNPTPKDIQKSDNYKSIRESLGLAQVIFKPGDKIMVTSKEQYPFMYGKKYIVTKGTEGDWCQINDGQGFQTYILTNAIDLLTDTAK